MLLVIETLGEEIKKKHESDDKQPVDSFDPNSAITIVEAPDLSPRLKDEDDSSENAIFSNKELPLELLTLSDENWVHKFLSFEGNDNEFNLNSEDADSLSSDTSSESTEPPRELTSDEKEGKKK